jgi:tRNA(fMet)-specific endonuclease VapC
LSYLLDTNVVIALMNDRPAQVRNAYSNRVTVQDPALVPSVVLFELWFGISKSQRYANNAAQLASFLAGTIEVVSFDAEDARMAGQIRATLERRGTPVGPYDILIAAQALRREAILVTANSREFGRIDGLVCEDWTTP